MASSFPTFKLSHGGGAIPVVAYGLGTANYKSAKGDLDQQTISYVKSAISTGLHHLDGAEAYGNEEELGAAISESSVDRSQIFLTTKILETIESPKKALEQSLSKLKTDYVDLYLIHAPFWDEKSRGITMEEAWKELEGLQKKGLAKAIGVSNFRVQDLERLKKVAEILPAVNQIEYSPYLQQPELQKYHKENSILTAAYGPLAPLTKAQGGPIDSLVETLSKKYNKTPTQIILRWVVDTGAVAITTSSKESRMKEALEVADFKLDQQDIDEISKLGQQKHKRYFWASKFND